MYVRGDAATVVGYRDRIVYMNNDLDRVAEAGQGFVDRIVDDLIDQMMQTDLTGRADIHRRALSDRVAALKHRDRIGTVFNFLCFSQVGLPQNNCFEKLSI